MVKKSVFLVLALSFLLILAAGCQTSAQGEKRPLSGAAMTDEQIIQDTTVQEQDNRGIVTKADDWIKENLW